MLPELTLITGIDVPFPEAQVTIHQPKIKEIAYIGEEYFLIGCETINLSKNSLSTQDKIVLEKVTNFDIIMSIMQDKSALAQKNRIGIMMLLTLVFPEYKIIPMGNAIALNKENEETHYINNDNFEKFKDILYNICCMKEFQGDKKNSEYNPLGSMSQKIADKLNRGREKAAEAKRDNSPVSLFNRYLSILSVGMGVPLSNLTEYTPYQIFDSFKRLKAKEEYDFYLQAKLQGAKGMDKIDNWMEDLYSDKEDNTPPITR